MANLKTVVTIHQSKVNFPKKRTFLTPWYAHVHGRVCGVPLCRLHFILGRTFVILDEVHLNKWVRTRQNGFQSQRLTIFVFYALNMLFHSILWFNSRTVIYLNGVFIDAPIVWVVIKRNYYNNYVLLHLYTVVFKTIHIIGFLGIFQLFLLRDLKIRWRLPES